MTNDGVAVDVRLRDLFSDDVLLITRLSERAHQAYSEALWYAWGRQDAGDHQTERPIGYAGYSRSADWLFAEYVALTVEAFHREYITHHGPIADLYSRFVAVLS